MAAVRWRRHPGGQAFSIRTGIRKCAGMRAASRSCSRSKRGFCGTVAERMAGVPVERVRFAPGFDLAGPKARTGPPSCGVSSGLPEDGLAFCAEQDGHQRTLEEALVVSLLESQESTVSPLLERPDPVAAPAVLEACAAIDRRTVPGRSQPSGHQHPCADHPAQPADAVQAGIRQRAGALSSRSPAGLCAAPAPGKGRQPHRLPISRKPPATGISAGFRSPTRNGSGNRRVKPCVARFSDKQVTAAISGRKPGAVCFIRPVMVS